MNPLLADLPTTVFEEIPALARLHGAVNLGQGFPDDPGPEVVRAHAARALMEGASMSGVCSARRSTIDHVDPNPAQKR